MKLFILSALAGAALAGSLPLNGFYESTQGILSPADMDFDLWKAVDMIRWDTFDYKVNQPVIDETKTVTTVTEPFDYTNVEDSY